MPLSLDRVGQIAVTVHDLDRAVAFYRDVLGMKLLFQVPPKMAFFDCGGIRLMLSLPEEAEFDHPGLHPLLQGGRHPRRLDRPERPRRRPPQRSPPRRPHARPRALDGVLPGYGGEHAGADERGAVERIRGFRSPGVRGGLRSEVLTPRPLSPGLPPSRRERGEKLVKGQD